MRASHGDRKAKIIVTFLQFIGINERNFKINAVALIEDKSEEGKSIAGDGIEIEFFNDADVLFRRAELKMQVTDEMVTKLQNAAQV